MSTSTTAFTENIQGYDIHTYYDNKNPEQTQFGKDLHEAVRTEFAELAAKGDIVLLKWVERAIGPHPITMFTTELHTPEAFARVVPFYQLHHGELSVLIHPISGKGDLLDHTKHALWLGEKQPLLYHLLK
ncbi:hypothetical protein BABINDRAFT_46552 [Babjeviella inositovora NRRL Y-12698]|uniref:DOPA 4,5-dioxygenase n=1 Tax=Babjeviella inositovora NRRL Y-12698 TaxID=984486 RepID=A0A1E3QV74_9ASCO|nr:uncharacterized protein BABINDRAFT_46552 [Babjeviella inositovora NRRL Y-12698]ODQ80952.1 hypothetical protein BABINDRAFT_46552 [Babjeviella inositovora NRRL Y-12698]